MNVSAPTLLFVYGSLKRGFANHSVLGSASFEAPARTAALYRLGRLDAYPALFDGGERRISGELYVASSADIARLDEFEGTDYERRPVVLEDGRRAQAYFATGLAADRSSPLDAAEWGLSPPGRAARTPGISAEIS